MDEQRYEMFEELIEKYSKAFYKKVNSLFELEDIKQEMWVHLIEVYNEENEQGTDRTRDIPFVAVTIRNHMINQIKREVMKARIIKTETNTVLETLPNEEGPTPEDYLIAAEQLALLSGKVSSIKHGNFVLNKTIEGYSTQEMSDLLKVEGVTLSRERVRQIQQKIKNILKEQQKILGK
jgi:RNA polymerase sigma factor (sigma-70 family)